MRDARLLVAVTASAVALASPGCIYSWGDPTTTTGPRIRHENVEPRTDALPGAGVLQRDGQLRFTVALARLCHGEKVVEDGPTITTHKQLNAGAYAVLAAAAAAFAGSVYGFIQVGRANAGSHVVLEAGAGTAGVIGGGLAIGMTLGYRYSDHDGATFPMTKVDTSGVTTTRDGIEETACNDGVARLGQLTLTTPWGTTATATPAADGTAIFAVDWLSETLDPTTPAGRAQIATPWQIASTSFGLAAAWTPTEAEVALAIELLTRHAATKAGE